MPTAIAALAALTQPIVVLPALAIALMVITAWISQRNSK
jgi:hypothetical protein